MVGYAALSHPTLLMDKNFLLLFFKKEVLPCVPAQINEGSNGECDWFRGGAAQAGGGGAGEQVLEG